MEDHNRNEGTPETNITHSWLSAVTQHFKYTTHILGVNRRKWTEIDIHLVHIWTTTSVPKYKRCFCNLIWTIKTSYILGRREYVILYLILFGLLDVWRKNSSLYFMDCRPYVTHLRKRSLSPDGSITRARVFSFSIWLSKHVLYLYQYKKI